MTSSKAPDRGGSLSEILAEFTDLRRDVAGLGDELIRTLENKWTTFHAALFPLISDWGHAWPVLSVHAYAVKGEDLEIVPTLSIVPRSDAPARLSLAEDLGALDGLGCTEPQLLGTLSRRAMAARELEMDFAEAWAVVPFVLIDAIVGLFVVQLRKPGLEPKQWPEFCAAAERLGDAMRREVFAGRLAEIKRYLSGGLPSNGGQAS